MSFRDYWKISEASIVADRFEKYFGVSFKPYYDGLVTVFQKRIVLDVVSFDDWLHEKWGCYEDSGKSMQDCIREHYGEDAESFIRELL